MLKTMLLVATLLMVMCPRPAAAQSAFEAAAQVTTATSGEFEGTDVGVGGRFAWRPTPLVGAEAEVNFYPSDYPDTVPFSGHRVEGLFGVTVGPRLGAWRPFLRVRPGLVTFSQAPEPFACILIFPPPLQCALAGGDTVFALDLGGGVEFFPTDRSVIRADIGDRALRFSGPAINSSGTIEDRAFFGHGFRFAAGAGVRF